jgi:type IV pilus assembly protein PilP
MMKCLLSIVQITFIILIMAGCSSSSEFKDLTDFMDETKRRPIGQIEPLPAFKPYQPFVYAAMTLRSPFERPTPTDSVLKGGRTVEPDMNREHEYLETFNIASLKMVGTFAKNGRLWSLIDDGQGKVTPVTVGNYMGKNYGKIISTEKAQIEVMEIVADGSSGWVERPRIIKLEEKE